MSFRSPTSTTPTELLDFVEAPSRFTSIGSGVGRSISDGMTLLAAEGYCAVQGIRCGDDDVAAALANVRTFMREHDVQIGSWWLCERSTPVDLENELVALGLQRVAGDYEVAGMLLDHEPPPAAPGVDARRVRTAEEYAAARELQYDVFDSPSGHRRTRAQLIEQFDRGSDVGAVYGAWIDDELIAVGRAFFAPQGALLAGGATLERARGRGAYRALVRARWDDVVERGGEALVVQAGSMSAPILRQLGFKQVLQFHRLEDVLPAA
jgi:hypothetical protein